MNGIAYDVGSVFCRLLEGTGVCISQGSTKTTGFVVMGLLFLSALVLALSKAHRL